MSLQFTGNWFIDLGILGFVNLMEEVYGEVKDEIEFLNISKEKFYQTFFLYYIKKTLTSYVQRQKIKKVKGNSEKVVGEFEKSKLSIIKEINEIVNEAAKQDLNKREEIQEKLIELNKTLKETTIENLRRFEDYLLKSFSNNKKTIIDKLQSIGMIVEDSFFQNLNFMNPGKNKSGNEKEVLQDFENMLFDYKIKEELTKDAFDKTISKFLFSEKEFSNVIMGKIPTIDALKKITPIDPIYILLSFPSAFNEVRVSNTRRYITFYTPKFKPTYHINKKLSYFVKLASENNRNNDLFEITWRSVIDYIVEEKSEFSLENMYLIEYQGIQQQNLLNVEYIGISKLQAEILIDDKIREALNTFIKVSEKGNKSNLWLLEEFLKNKPLLPLFYRNLMLYCKDNKNKPHLKAMIYAAAVDKVISELNREKSKSLFSDEFFNRYKTVVEEIRENVRTYFGLKSGIARLFSGSDNQRGKDSLAYRLFTRLRKNHKYGFVNEVLKAFNSLDEKKNINFVVSHLFNNILQNDTSWQSDAVPIIAGLISKGGEGNEH